MIGAKPWRIRFDKAYGYIRVYDGNSYLVLFWGEKYGLIYSRIRYLVRIKSGISYVIFYNYEKIKVDSCDSLSLEKTLTLHNVIILIKSVFKKDKNNCYYYTFLEKGWYELPKNNDYK